MAAATAVVSRRGTDQFRGLFSDTFSVVATLNASSLADGVGETNTIAVPGVKLGDIVMMFGWCKFYKAGQRGRAAWLWGRLKTAPFKGKYGYFPMFAKQELCDLQSALRHQDNDGAPRVSAGRRKASRGSTRACQTSNGQTP